MCCVAAVGLQRGLQRLLMRQLRGLLHSHLHLYSAVCAAPLPSCAPTLLLFSLSTLPFWRAGASLLKLLALLLVAVAAFTEADPANAADPSFTPGGAEGVFYGVSICYYAYVGFDALTNAAEEVRAGGALAGGGVQRVGAGLGGRGVCSSTYAQWLPQTDGQLGRLVVRGWLTRRNPDTPNLTSPCRFYAAGARSV